VRGFEKGSEFEENDGYNSFIKIDAKETKKLDLLDRMVQTPCILIVAPQELFLLLSQKNEAEAMSQTQPVSLGSHSSSNRFLNSMPLVNPDQKHYTPCFILEDEKVVYLSHRITTMTMT